MKPAQAPPQADQTIHYSMIAVGCVGVALATVALLMAGARPALGVALGSAIAAANLAVFSRVVRGLLGEGPRRRLWILVGIIKIFVLFGGVWWLLRSAVASGLAMVIGYGALPLGITIGGFIAPKPGELGEAATDEGAAARSPAEPSPSATDDATRPPDADQAGFPSPDLIMADSQSEDPGGSESPRRGPASK